MITFTGYLLSIKSIDGRAENGVVLVGYYRSVCSVGNKDVVI